MIDGYFVLSTETLRHARILTASCCYAKYGCQARIARTSRITTRIARVFCVMEFGLCRHLYT